MPTAASSPLFLPPSPFLGCHRHCPPVVRGVPPQGLAYFEGLGRQGPPSEGRLGGLLSSPPLTGARGVCAWGTDMGLGEAGPIPGRPQKPLLQMQPRAGGGVHMGEINGGWEGACSVLP